MTKVVHLYASQRVSRRAKDGIDGTSVTIINKSVTYQISESGTETPTGNWSDKVVATTDTKPYLWTRTIVVYSDTNSTTSYSVSYKGKDGAPGKDAYRVEISPSTLVFDTNDNGVVDGSALGGKYATVTVYKGSQKISVDNLSLPSNYATKKHTNVDGRIYNTNGEARITITEIEQETISGDEKVSKSSGQISFPIDVLGERNTLMWATVNVQVNVAKFTGSVVVNNKQYESKFEEISTRFKNTPTNKNLTDAESRITQTAREISLSVSEKVIGRRNLLVNSAFRNQDSVFIHSSACIEKNTGLDGINCIHSSDKYSGTGDGNYIGAFWDSTQKNGVVTNIPIVKGKKYVISCWIKSDNLDLPFSIECLYMKSINQQNRDGSKSAKIEVFKVTEKNKWEKISCVLDTNNEKATEYLAVNFWTNNKNVPKVTDATGATYYPTCHAYICKPMMEEGDTYSGWTLSEDDYDYVGGNMIDNARTLEVGGSLKSINASNVADYGLAYYGDSMSLRINNTNDSTPSIMTFTPSLEVGVDYIFSFMAKGTANIGLYALCDNSVDGDYLLSEDSVNAGVREIDTLKSRYAPIVLIPTQLTTEYKRYWGHMRFYGHVPTKLYLQLNGAGEVYICQPKLEVGATMTEFTERKTDLVDKASLKKAGIEVTSTEVKLYGEKVRVMNQVGNDDNGDPTYKKAAMFSNGKLNADLIDAGEVVANGINAKEVTATKLNVTGNSTFGIWTVDGDQITTNGSFTFNGATFTGKAIQYTAGFVRAGATSSQYMRLGAYTAEFGEARNNAYNGIWFGYAANVVYNGGSNVWNLPTDYKYKERESATTSGTPTAYIHNTDSGENPAFAINRPNGGVALRTNGALKGSHAFNTRRTILTSIIMQSGEGLVVCTSDNATSVYLPKNPVIGEMVTIIQSGNGKLSIYGNGHKTISGKDVESDGRTSETKGQINLFFFDGVRWICTYITNWLGKV